MADDDRPFGPSSLLPVPADFQYPTDDGKTRASKGPRPKTAGRDRARVAKGIDEELGLRLDEIGKKKDSKSLFSALKKIKSIADIKEVPGASSSPFEFPISLMPTPGRSPGSLSNLSTMRSAPNTPSKRVNAATPATPCDADHASLNKFANSRAPELSALRPLSQVLSRPSTASSSGPTLGSRRSSASSLSFRLPRSLTSQSLTSVGSYDSVHRAWLKEAAIKPFDQHRMPTEEEIDKAKGCYVVDRDGDRYRFGDLIQRKGPTIVCFIRHFYCGLCAAYVSHLASFFNEQQHYATRARLNQRNVRVIIIGNGSYQHISKYLELTNSPFHIYTDPTPNDDLFVTLGMTRRTLDPGASKDKGEYLSDMSMLQNLASSTKSGFRLPFASPGDMKRLGGEFIFAPTNHPTRAATNARRLSVSARTPLQPLTAPSTADYDERVSSDSTAATVGCEESSSKGHERRKSVAPPKQTPIEDIEIGVVYAHRMKTTRDHGSVRELFAAVGVDLRLAKSCLDE